MDGLTTEFPQVTELPDLGLPQEDLKKKDLITNAFDGLIDWGLDWLQGQVERQCLVQILKTSAETLFKDGKFSPENLINGFTQTVKDISPVKEA